ncbi:MAG: hypothetical protein M0R80_16545 [Proteobacteria bacterium]|nr:hypothetical protein [Pseudomonadota bacterium]
MLERELATYRANHAQLLGDHKGKFVLIKDDDVVDVFASIDDALKHGYELFENEPFLVKQVLEVDVPQNFTSFQIAI